MTYYYMFLGGREGMVYNGASPSAAIDPHLMIRMLSMSTLFSYCGTSEILRYNSCWSRSLAPFSFLYCTVFLKLTR